MLCTFEREMRRMEVEVAVVRVGTCLTTVFPSIDQGNRHFRGDLVFCSNRNGIMSQGTATKFKW